MNRYSRRKSKGDLTEEVSHSSSCQIQNQYDTRQTVASMAGHITTKRRKYRLLSTRLKQILPNIRTSSYLTLGMLVCLQLLTMSTVLHCAKTFYMHWNTTNSIFRIDNTDHIIDVNKGNSAFEYDQVHIICPVYEPGTFDNETEKYIIYNVSKVEYETCRITNHDPRIIAICDKPNKLMFFTITFRPFTPQPGGLEFLPGNDYYFISTSSKDDLHRRIGGRCSTNNMKVVFKVCCADDQQPHANVSSSNNNVIPSSTAIDGSSSSSSSGGDLGGHSSNGGGSTGVSINTNVGGASSDGTLFDSSTRLHPSSTVNTSQGNIVQSTVNWPVWNGGNQQPHRPVPSTPAIGGGSNGRHQHHYTPIPPRTAINNYNNNYGGGSGSGAHSNSNNYNNPPSNAHQNNNNNKPTKKTTSNNDYDKHPNEVVKNEELTYNNSAASNGSLLGLLVLAIICSHLHLLLLSPSRSRTSSSSSRLSQTAGLPNTLPLTTR
ncbi:ephrin-B3 [Uranotaenia lowii]|uniref:ephrin-B3 n=1 Tax=Uranotaenia lowii TaxID=190385 RepID=UPI002478AFD5|nr:ephrin-B3 [Uranotaenia lowii]